MANRGRLRIDADGFRRTSEERYDDKFSGKRLYELFVKDPTNPSAGFRPGTGFWNPGKSEYLLPLPRQLSPTWFRDPRLEHHVLKAALWTFAAGTFTQTFSPSHAHPFADPAPHNEWISLHTGTSSVASLDSCDYAQLGQAAGGLIFPDGMKTLGLCGQTPPSVGQPLGTGYGQHYTPHFQAVIYPAPDNTIVFGWSNLAIVLFGAGGYLLRSPSGSKHDWERLAWWPAYGGPAGFTVLAERGGHTGGDLVAADTRGVLVAELGARELFLAFSAGGGTRVPWRDEAGPQFMPPGPWWVGGATAQTLTFQAQVVGYEGTNTSGNRPTLFDVGTEKAPTQAPVYTLAHVMHLSPGESNTVSHGASGYTVESPRGEKITYMLQDAVSLLEWASDGIAHRGTFFLGLVPANPGLVNAGYLAPQVKLFELSFPAHIVLRENDEFILHDTAFDHWSAEVSYYDAGHGQFRVLFRVLDGDPGSEGLILEANGYPERFGFPVVYEETPEVGPPDWEPRWVAWAESIELDEKASESDEHGARHYLLKGKPLLHRARRRWTYPPRIFNPASVPPGTVEHTFSVAATLRSANFNTSDLAEVYIQPDPASGTERARLPGTWGTPAGQARTDDDDDCWGPTWSEEMLAYLQRVAHQWSGWVIYSDLRGKVWYHPDLLQGLAAGEWLYLPTITLYQRIQDAEAASVNRMQVYAETGFLLDRPKANVITVYGKDDAGQVVRAIARDSASITDITSPNFSGEENLTAIVARMAVGDTALAQLALIKLRRDGRKRVLRQFRVDLAPWELEGGAPGAPFDVGHCFNADLRGTFVCIHLAVEGFQRGVYKTTITAERIPVNSVLGPEDGPFPGTGADEE